MVDTLKKMDVKVAKDNGKIRIQNDEMIVRVNTKETVKHTQINLKSKFEESVALVRALEKPPKHHRSPKTVMPSPPTPTFNHHPVVQTLLKIVWSCHLEKFKLITTTFQGAIKSKIICTKKLRDFDATLVSMENEVIRKIRNESQQKMREKIDEQLVQIREALRKEGDLDELIEIAIERGIASTGEEREFFAPRFEATLSSFDIRAGTLWEEWKLQVERHKLVSQGKLEALAQIDEKIASLDVKVKEEERAVSEDDGVAMFSQLYRSMVEQLSTLKLEQELHALALRKYEQFLREKMKVVKMRAYAKIRADIIQDEQVSIESASSFLKDEVAKLKKTQDQALAELKIATSRNLDHDLKSMQVSIDLTLESAREYLYNEGLDNLLQWA